MRAIVKKWAHGVSVQIPRNLLKSVRLCVGDAVELRVEAGRIVVEPLQRRGFELAKLLAGITKKNVHPEIDPGAPVGYEVW